MSENKRRRSSSTGFWGRIRQSARHIENEAKEGARRVEHSAAEGARRVQHDAQERVRNMTPKQKNGWKKAGRIIGTLLLVFVLTASIFAGIFMAYINSAMRGKVEVYLDEFETQVSTELYYQDPDTQEWVMYQTLYMDENRIWVDLENIPKYLQEAAIAIEDKRFEKHHGVDWKGTTRAILYTLFGKNVQGGSTITQQLVKNVTGDNQVTVKRKITEIYRALELEKRYEKDEILEAYLNEVYFGQRCSGVMTAARVYFGKDVSELSLAECASMMGITNNPSMYDPFISSWTRENNRERQLTILSEMLSQGKIDQEEYDAAVAEDIQFANGFTISGKYVGSDGTVTEPDTEDTTDTSDDTDSPADDSTPTIKGSNSWFTDAMITDVAEALVEKLGITEKVNSEGKKVSAYDQAINMVYSKGYKIYTTQNPKYQKIAEDVCYNLENIPYTSSYTNAAGEQVEDQLQIALTIVDPTNGYVVAMIGGAGEKVVDRGWNWATSARQCGSAIKPLSVYAPALDAGVITPASVIDDYPVEMLGGSIWPVNAYSGYRSIMTLQDAIRNSSNPTAVRTAIKLTLPSSYAFMTENLSFTTLTNDDMTAAGALALGGLSKGVTTREMAAAYATFARGGVYTTPRTYTEVLDHNGNVILENKTESHVAMNESTAYAMNELLKNVVRSGTGTGANFSGMTIAGKTGSTNSNNDRYFVGYTPYYTAAVWVGYDTPTRIVASGNPAATLWKTFMSKVHAGLPNKDFEVSSADMVSVTVCTQTGLLASAGCPSQTVKVAKSYAPSLSCDGHISVTVCADSGMLASDYCPNVTTAYVLDLSQPNVSSGWGYKRELLTTPLSAALQATYQAQLEEGLISSIPAGEPVRTNSGTVQLYSDLMYSGMCTTHTTPLEPTPDPDAPDDGSGTTPGGDATTGGDSGTQTPSDNTGTAGDSASGDVGDNGQFLNWLLNNGGTGR